MWALWRQWNKLRENGRTYKLWSFVTKEKESFTQISTSSSLTQICWALSNGSTPVMNKSLTNNQKKWPESHCEQFHECWWLCETCCVPSWAHHAGSSSFPSCCTCAWCAKYFTTTLSFEGQKSDTQGKMKKCQSKQRLKSYSKNSEKQKRAQLFWGKKKPQKMCASAQNNKSWNKGWQNNGKQRENWSQRHTKQRLFCLFCKVALESVCYPVHRFLDLFIRKVLFVEISRDGPTNLRTQIVYCSQPSLHPRNKHNQSKL